MLRGLYSSASALLAETAWQNTIASDLGNIDTPGYKSEQTEVAAFGQELLARTGQAPSGAVGDVAQGAVADTVVPSWQGGGVQQTGRPLDVAPTTGQWLSVRMGGVAMVTQDGALQVDASGTLTTAGGARVMSVAGGPIVIPVGATAAVLPDGTVTANGVPVGRLALVTVGRPNALVGQGASLYAPGAGAQVAAAPAAQAAVTPGALVAANVSAEGAMSDMIEAGTAFAANQETLKTGTDAFTQLLGAIQR